MLCLAKVAACAELPRAQVTTSCGGAACRCRTSSASGAGGCGLPPQPRPAPRGSRADMGLRGRSLPWILQPRAAAILHGAPAVYSGTARQDAGVRMSLAGSLHRVLSSGSRAIETEISARAIPGIDVWEPSEILDAMIEGQFAAVAAVRGAAPAMEDAALAMEARLDRQRAADLCRRGHLGTARGAGRRRADADLLLAAGTPPAADRRRRQGALHAVEGAEDEAEAGAEIINSHEVGTGRRPARALRRAARRLSRWPA